MTTASVQPLRHVAFEWPVFARWLLALVYIGFGIYHLIDTRDFLAIMPPGIPAPYRVVQFTGLCEAAGGIGLLIHGLRRAAGIGLALYAVCVYPANLYHAFWHVHVGHLPSSWWYHGPRLAMQPVFVWWALYAGGVTAWPFRSTRAAQASR